ncbi:type I polyketide synthase [Marinovum sp.]|uniref:type I polyketide synthase n=1 Tax=Marinovum sp. TaxID=2024839 RepID=UPI002B2692AB|nr:SDR family NAD(P)-dependent oxidoreductase [Marinovum sp.]
MSAENHTATVSETDIAIVGMAARLPGAASVAAFWENLRAGRSSIVRLDEEALREAGESPGLMRHRNYVPYAAPLDGFADFDAEFFGLSPKDAAIMDPQHRQFLECAWEAMESAGRPPEAAQGPVGVFAGSGMGSYFYFNVCSNPDLVDQTGMFLLRHTGNDKDFMATRLSHVLDLKGPSLNLQTACSTSLVATHYAAQSLINGECDMALAGGATIELPQGRGYLYKENEILSPDGQCHAFDHRAQGTVFGSGVGVVVLRRLADALRDGDPVWAVIKGSAVNNDGAAKAGYLAPSVEGQAAAIAEAQAMAGVSAETIDYVECHGTGTYLGDPIEVAALTQAFEETTDAKGFCRIGSVKTNIGHLDTAAGVASLIKTSLALSHREMPPSLGYEKPNPAIDFEGSPFRVNDRLTPWAAGTGPRRAGVNSLGVGGTNAHVVLEEAPERPASEASDWPFHILTVTGRSKAAVEANARKLAAHLRAHPEQSLADVAYTLETGRRKFEHRRVLVAESHDQAADLLETLDPRRVFAHSALEASPEVVFMFPGGGAQYAGMARDLYETEPVFADWIDRGLEILQPKLDYDIRALWLPREEDRHRADARLKQPSVQLPLILIVEYALARLWQSWGVEPAALVGHSMGENAAACLAGVMSFEDCIGLVHLRGQLFDTVPAGGMLSVSLSAEALTPYLGEGLDLASVNAPELSVASGPQAALDALEVRLTADGIDCQRVAIDIAAHSAMLEPILGRFRAYLKGITLHPPRIPVISNRSGQPLTADEATDPDYWVGHLRNTVQFARCIGTLAQTPNRVFLEVGPGKALASLARLHPDLPANQVLGSLRHPEDAVADDAHFLAALGRLSALGVAIDWDQIWGEARRNRVVLPSYAFQHQTYYIEPGEARDSQPESFLTRSDEIETWASRIAWVPGLAACEVDVETELHLTTPETWLMFMDDAGLARRVAEKLRAANHTVIEVWPGDAFARAGEGSYVLAPERGREGYDLLIRDLMAHGVVPSRVAHFWLVTRDEGHRPGSSYFHRVQEQGFYSLLFLAQAMEEESLPKPLHITALTNGAARVRQDALRWPEKSTLAGPLRVIPHELPGVTTALLDLELPEGRTRKDRLEPLALQVLEDLLAPPLNSEAALRGAKRFVRAPRALPLPASADPSVREGGTYLITGGFGGIGLSISRRLVAEGARHIVLVSRSALPPRSDWDRHCRAHGPQDATTRRIEAVAALEADGAEVLIAEADVSNLQQMQAVAEQATERFGAIHGVIHAAGVVDDAPLLAKTQIGIENVLTPKIHGAKVLAQLFPDGALDWLVLFSSSSTVTAPAGQVDYVAANEYLNAVAQSCHGGKTRVLALNWGIWAEVGMAARAVAERTGDLPAPPRTPAGQPLLDTATFDDTGARMFEASWRPSERWALDEHRTRDGRALLPGTGYLELAAEALATQGETGPYAIRDLTFLRPLHTPDDSDTEIRLHLRRSDAGYAMQVRSAVTHQGRTGWQLHAEAELALKSQPMPPPLDLAAIRGRCEGGQFSEIPLRSAQEMHLDFGPRWRVLRATALGRGEGIADLVLPPEAGDDRTPLHPALMDIATGWAMELIAGYDPAALWVPMSYGQVQVFGPLPDHMVSWVRIADRAAASDPVARFDITLTDTEGRVCVAIEGFSIKRLDSGSFAAAPRPTAAELRFDAADEVQPLSPAEERLQHNLGQGIRPNEGAEAFLRALATDLPQLVVSSLDLPALIAQSGQSAATPTGGQQFERPDLDTDFVAPETDIERTLAGFWQELLGVGQIGAEDNFFDLGGHSLIAVRLFAMIKKTYRAEFPISVLFEAPTIRACAALIAARVGPQAAEEGPQGTEEDQRRFTHVVPMHEGEGSDRTPFFLVAGMFGNVLNLRHLANLIGSDRPFYGLQARGLYGDDQPHRDIREAARDYIAELRQVQPQGPYLLGGFSGGGITAYEMAHQLEAVGEEVALVVMLDTPLPVRRSLTLKDRALIQWQELRRGGLAYPLRWAARRIRWELDKRRAVEIEETPEHQFHNAAIEAAFYDAVAAYPMRGWCGNLHLFRPPMRGKWQVSGGRLVDGDRAYVLPDNDWTGWVPGLNVEEVPGTHDSMVLEPNVRVLAARIRAAIEAAEVPNPVYVPSDKAAE